MKILFVDNLDSFTYNVVHLLAGAGAAVDVHRNDNPRLTGESLDAYDALVVGPGPGRPSDSPAAGGAIAAAAARAMPVLGVCLGHQAIGEVFGARITHAPALVHGKTSAIAHDGSALFAGMPESFAATRYHSLCIDPRSLPRCLAVTARSADGVIQAVAHRTLPIYGVQFHPESVASECGAQLASNFLARCVAARLRLDAKDRAAEVGLSPVPRRPIERAAIGRQ